MGYHLLLSDYQSSKRTSGKGKKMRRTASKQGLRRTTDDHGGERDMPRNKIPNTSVSVRLCESAPRPSVVCCLLCTSLPFPLPTNAHTQNRLRIRCQKIVIDTSSFSSCPSWTSCSPRFRIIEAGVTARQRPKAAQRSKFWVYLVQNNAAAPVPSRRHEEYINVKTGLFPP